MLNEQRAAPTKSIEVRLLVQMYILKMLEEVATFAFTLNTKSTYPTELNQQYLNIKIYPYTEHLFLSTTATSSCT